MSIWYNPCKHIHKLYLELHVTFVKQLLMIILLSTLSWGCAVCKVKVPDVNVSINQTHTQESIILDVNWKFKRYFTAETQLTYDENRNEKLDPKEMAAIHAHFVEYLKPNKYLTHIKYVESVDAYENAEYLSFEVKDAKTDIVDGNMEFRYTLTLQTPPRADETLYVTLFDAQRYFNFFISNVTLQDETLSTSIVKSSYSALFVPFGKPENINTDGTANAIVLSGEELYEEEPKPEGFLGLLTVAMETLKDRLLDLVEDIVMNESISSYLWLLLFSFAYGIIHALGPGHGKSLVAAYFLGNNRSVMKAFSIASLIGVVHTFSAFLLTFTLYYILNAYLSEYFEDLEYVTIKISAMIIILIALYLLYKKLPKKQKVTPQWSTDNPTQHISTCGCGACKSTSSDLGIILSAGIVPCPGTITVFVFTLSFGAYMLGFLSAVFMSIGMSLVIFFAALLTLKVRQNTSGEGKLRAILDYGSLLFILSLGLILLLV